MGRALESLPATCALDAAEERERTLAEVGALLGVTGEAARLLEASAVRKVRLYVLRGDE